MIPVNLRNYFPSRSMANFFGWIEISCYFQPDTAFEDILRSVKEQFAKELSKDVIEAKLNDLVSLEKIRSCVWYHWRSKPRSFLPGRLSEGGLSRRSIPMWGSSGCRRNIGNIFRDSDFLQARTVCSCVPVLLEMRWF